MRPRYRGGGVGLGGKEFPFKQLALTSTTLGGKKLGFGIMMTRELYEYTSAEPLLSRVIAENLTLDVRPGDLVLFTGPSGSGKSSLLRAVGAQLGARDAAALELPDVPLIDA